MSQIMPKHVWSVICSKTSIDKDSNNISLFEVLEQLKFDLATSDIDKLLELTKKDCIVAPFNIAIVSLWHRDKIDADEIFDVKIEITDPTGKTLRDFDHEVKIERGTHRTRMNVSINGIPVTESGMYWIKIMSKSKTSPNYSVSAELPLEITLNITKEEAVNKKDPR